MARGKQQARKPKANKRKGQKEDSEPPAKLVRCDSENTQLKAAITEAVDQKPTTSKSSSASLDRFFQVHLGLAASVKATGEYACMLNQTDIKNNNNKFYVVQIAQKAKSFYLFTRWGRVGEDGQNKTETFGSLDEAAKSFMKKFQDKTGNKWENRDSFEAKPQKYTLLIIDTEDSDDDVADGPSSSGLQKSLVVKGKTEVKVKIEQECLLDDRTQLAMKLIFSDDMFRSQMAEMKLDLTKMPLGKLSKVQIAKGLAVLIDIEEVIKNGGGYDKLTSLSSKFFTLIPHSFGRNLPPVLANVNEVTSKKEVMMTLADIELAQSLKAVKEEAAVHQLDTKYNALGCELELLKKNTKDFKLIQRFAKATVGDFNLLDAWKVDRKGELERFSVNSDLENHKLLWHGTSVAVVAAILNSGLRIMPHSGGTLGKGIYLASECDKSYGYVGVNYGDFEGENNVGFMFLCEAALGRIFERLSGDGSIKKAPDGYNSVLGAGRNEPNPKIDVKMTMDDQSVTVPVGKPVPQAKFKNSNFYQSEYLVYNEHQIKMRYLLKFSR